MQKIISLFQRNYDGDRLVRDEIVPGAEWVVAGEGVATRKYDGTACMVKGGKLFKRYDAKEGKPTPPNFEPCMEEADPVTKHFPGWVPVGNGTDDKWHREAWRAFYEEWKSVNEPVREGTYELCGPKVQGNPEGFRSHALIRHGCDVLPDAPRTFATLSEWFRGKDIEGIVWWHSDGRMVKIKKRDFGLRRKED